MGKRLVAGTVVAALVIGLGIDLVATDLGADGTALRAARSAQPQAGWSITKRTFEPWADVVSRGTVRFTGGSGPAWVLQLSAPSDSQWANYSAVVVVNAVTGSVAGASVLATK
jgi:hypothetical protein